VFYAFVLLFHKVVKVIVVVPFFQWENLYIKITTPSHVFSHKMGMVDDITVLFSDPTFLIISFNTLNVKYSKNLITENGPKLLYIAC